MNKDNLYAELSVQQIVKSWLDDEIRTKSLVEQLSFIFGRYIGKSYKTEVCNVIKHMRKKGKIKILMTMLVLLVPSVSKASDEVKYEIIRQANFYGVSVNTALRIAECESNFNPNAQSKKSTAKGVYQFLDGTWKFVKANGSPFDYKENIKQFMLTYPKKPHWWVCQ